MIGLKAKIEPKSPSTPDVHADAQAHEDARDIAQAIILKLRKGTLIKKTVTNHFENHA